MSEEIGRYLRQARESIGLSLDQLQGKTKIQKPFLIAIENGEFEKLPSPFYVRTYLRSYANQVKVEPHHILRHYRKEEQAVRYGQSNTNLQATQQTQVQPALGQQTGQISLGKTTIQKPVSSNRIQVHTALTIAKTTQVHNERDSLDRQGKTQKLSALGKTTRMPALDLGKTQSMSALGKTTRMPALDPSKTQSMSALGKTTRMPALDLGKTQSMPAAGHTTRMPALDLGKTQSMPAAGQTTQIPALDPSKTQSMPAFDPSKTESMSALDAKKTQPNQINNQGKRTQWRTPADSNGVQRSRTVKEYSMTIAANEAGNQLGLDASNSIPKLDSNHNQLVNDQSNRFNPTRSDYKKKHSLDHTQTQPLSTSSSSRVIPRTEASNRFDTNSKLDSRLGSSRFEPSKLDALTENKYADSKINDEQTKLYEPVSKTRLEQGNGRFGGSKLEDTLPDHKMHKNVTNPPTASSLRTANHHEQESDSPSYDQDIKKIEKLTRDKIKGKRSEKKASFQVPNVPKKGLWIAIASVVILIPVLYFAFFSSDPTKDSASQGGTTSVAEDKKDVGNKDNKATTGTNAESQTQQTNIDPSKIDIKKVGKGQYTVTGSNQLPLTFVPKGKCRVAINDSSGKPIYDVTFRSSKDAKGSFTYDFSENGKSFTITLTEPNNVDVFSSNTPLGKTDREPVIKVSLKE